MNRCRPAGLAWGVLVMSLLWAVGRSEGFITHPDAPRWRGGVIAFVFNQQPLALPGKLVVPLTPDSDAALTLRRAARAWEQVPGTLLDFPIRYSDPGSLVIPVSRMDGLNVVSLIQVDWPDAVARTFWRSDGDDLVNADILFDLGSRYYLPDIEAVRLERAQPFGAYVLAKVARHEMGHALGLAHEWRTVAVMRPGAAWLPPTVFGDDQFGARFLYASSHRGPNLAVTNVFAPDFPEPGTLVGTLAMFGNGAPPMEQQSEFLEEGFLLVRYLARPSRSQWGHHVVTFENRGTEPIDDARLGLYLSSDDHFDPGVDRLLSFWRGSLPRDSFALIDFQFQLPGDVSLGVHEVLAVADPTDLVREVDERVVDHPPDNVVAAPTRVWILRPEAPLVHVEVSPEPILVGEPLTARFETEEGASCDYDPAWDQLPAFWQGLEVVSTAVEERDGKLIRVSTFAMTPGATEVGTHQFAFVCWRRVGTDRAQTREPISVTVLEPDPANPLLRMTFEGEPFRAEDWPDPIPSVDVIVAQSSDEPARGRARLLLQPAPAERVVGFFVRTHFQGDAGRQYGTSRVQPESWIDVPFGEAGLLSYEIRVLTDGGNPFARDPWTYRVYVAPPVQIVDRDSGRPVAALEVGRPAQLNVNVARAAHARWPAREVSGSIDMVCTETGSGAADAAVYQARSEAPFEVEVLVPASFGDSGDGRPFAARHACRVEWASGVELGEGPLAELLERLFSRQGVVELPLLSPLRATADIAVDGRVLEALDGIVHALMETDAESRLTLTVAYPGSPRVATLDAHVQQASRDPRQGEPFLQLTAGSVQPGTWPDGTPVTLHAFHLRSDAGVSFTAELILRLSAVEADEPGIYLRHLSLVVEEPQFIRGDSNGDGQVAVNDPIFTLSYLFRGGEAPRCPDAADADDDGRLLLADAIYTLQHLFLSGAPLPPPGRIPGSDPTADSLPPCIP